MAALDRRHPNLDDFVGLNWSCWVDRVNILPSDAVFNAEDNSKYGRNRSETMTLRKEDMHIYGHCPAHDDIYLVVCSHCGQVVKPQAFEKHCERQHGGQSFTAAPPQQPRSASSPNLSSSGERQKEASLPVQQHRQTKTQKEAMSFPSVEKSLQENPPHPSHFSSTPHPRVSPWHSGPLPPGHRSSSTSPSERASAQKPTAGLSSESPLRGMRTYSRIFKNIDKKECDQSKHVSVLDPERKKLCSRELVCNNGSIHQQKKALGRTKTFDQLVVEQRTASESRNMEQLLAKSKDKEQHLEAFEERATTQGSKYNFNSNCHILRSTGTSDSFPGEEDESTVEVDVQPPYPFNQSLLSSEESEEDEQKEATGLPATRWHPKPLGLCTFGCRTLGCSIFTFDRRWHHLRFALSAMLEHHVNTHLWKKMPRVSSGLRSLHVTPSTVGPPVRTKARPSKSTGSLSLGYTSLGQLETKSSQHNAHGTKAPSRTASASLGPGRQRHPAGRSSEARRREAERVQGASTAQSAAKSSSKCIREPPLHEKGQPRAPPSHGPLNGTFSHGKKPCPPPLRSPHRGRALGSQQKGAGYDPRAVGQKRKGGNESPPVGSSLARTSKSRRLSSPARSSLLSWKGENMGDVLAWGLDERPDS